MTKSNLPAFFLTAAILIFATSCDRPVCSNTNRIFETFRPDSQEYKGELAKQIRSAGQENLSYSFEGYSLKSDKEFITIHIQGTKLCATGEIQVNDWKKLSGMRRETSGFRGAELKGLKLEIRQDSTGTNFIYEDVDTVID